MTKISIESAYRGTDWPTDCAEVTADHLALVRSLLLAQANITALQKHDFSGLVSLTSLVMIENPLTELPEGIFEDTSRLNRISLQVNSLNTLSEGVFQGLIKLRRLTLADNSLTALPEGIFRGLGDLESLVIGGNSISALPEGVFRGLSKLELLDLWGNPFRELPEGVFQGLDSLEWLYLNRNHLQELPEGIFRGLDSLKILFLTRNSLLRLPPGIFRGLDSIEGLYLSRNGLTALPEDLFQGLDTLKSLSLYRNNLVILTRGIFDGLDSLSALTLQDNGLPELPAGIFDDVLDTLGSEFVLASFSTHDGRLIVSSHLQAVLAFDSPGQQAPEGATVRVGVTLSRASPVAVRAPYTVGIGEALGGLEGFSPPPGRGLLFPAGETRGEIVFTVPEEAGTQGARTVVLTLGKPSEIGLRRSDGRGPDAPYLDSESLVLRPAEGAVHTVTVSDFDPESRRPHCRSLWGGAPCSTPAVLPHAVAGPLGGSVARTEVVLTNRDPRSGRCEAALLFGRGTESAGPVSFDGRFPEGNLLRATLPGGGAEIVTLEAPAGEAARTGAVHVFTRSPCSGNSLTAQGRILTEDPGSGEIEEMVSLATQSPRDWLGDGDCRVLAGVFGNGREVALSAVTAEPGHRAPPGTRLGLRALDLAGKFLRPLPGLEISGAQQVLSVGRWSRPLLIEACLNVPAAGSPFRLAVTAIGWKAAGSRTQYGVESLPGGGGP
ncbi:MAG: leucine-rich repeat domain-containing protein [Acidobacteriota bacterium]|nr:leucine-rich repeat domain-containing protein [Acidobacteriota bacterium]